MHLISALSLWAGHTLSKIWRRLSIPQILQVKVLDLQTCTLSKILPAPTTSASLQTARRTKNRGDVISEGAVIKASTFGSDDAPKEWTWQEVLFRGLKTLNPRREVKSVVIYIYLFSFACISFPFCILTFSHCIIIFPLAYLLFYISNALEKKIKIFVCLAAS